MAPIFIMPWVAFIVFGRQSLKVKFCLAFFLSIFMIAFYVYAQKSSTMGMGTSLESVLNKINLQALNNTKPGGVPAEFHSLKDLVVFLPMGIFTALFRPLPGDVNTLMGFGAGLEGLLVLGLFLRACIRTSLRELKDPFIVFLLLLIFSWALVYAFNAQNMGTIMRWRLPVFPVFLGLLLYLGRHKKGRTFPLHNF